MTNFYTGSQANFQIAGTSPATCQLVQLCERSANSSAPILLFGPAGCEFEKIAAYIHRLSDRAGYPFTRQRCVHWQDSIDPIKTAGSGTLFVEGIQHASLPAQLRLLAELDEAKLSNRKSDGAMPTPPRIIVSAGEDLYSLVENGMLLEDLHWQLCALALRVPALAERSEDIPAIAQQIMDSGDLWKSSSTAVRLSESTCRVLQSYAWPGNYRQLQSVLQRAVALVGDSSQLEISQADLDYCEVHWQSQRAAYQAASPMTSGATENCVKSSEEAGSESSTNSHTGSASTDEHSNVTLNSKSIDMNILVQAVVEKGIVEADRAHRESHSFVVDRVEKALIAAVMAQCGNVQKAAAQKLGMNRNTLHKKIKDYGLE